MVAEAIFLTIMCIVFVGYIFVLHFAKDETNNGRVQEHDLLA